MGRNAGGVVKPGGTSGNRHIEEYVSGEGMWINQYLRGRMEGTQLSPREQAFLAGLDKATDKTIGNPVTLYRSVDASAIFGNMSQVQYENLHDYLVYGDKQAMVAQSAKSVLSRVKEGSVHTEKGFMSTTKSESTAVEWGGFTGSDMPVVMKISAPKGTKGVDLSKHKMGQDEVLLKRNQRYRVNKIYGSRGNITVDVSILK